MSLAELFPVVRSLPHQDKLRLLHFLAGELVREEGLTEIVPGGQYPIWSPFDAYDAARALEQVLRDSEARP
jgi:hypothetical protein